MAETIKNHETDNADNVSIKKAEILSGLFRTKDGLSWNETSELLNDLIKLSEKGAVSGSLLKDWQMWEDCILSFLRSHRGLRDKFNEHVDEWNTHTKLPPSAYERGEQ